MLFAKLLLFSSLLQFAVAATCSAGCSTEFVSKCIPFHCSKGKDSSGAWTQCRGEIDGTGSPIANVCTSGCDSTEEMLRVKTTACDGTPSTTSTTTSTTSTTSSTKEPEEKPTTPTLCSSKNQGSCPCGSGTTQTYVFWSPSSMQRCVHTTNLPTDKLAKPRPVMLQSAGYSGGSITINSMHTTASYYGFTIISLSSLLKDGAGGFSLQFGNNGIANDENPTPCSENDSRDIAYLKTLFAWIEQHPQLDSSKVFINGFSQESMYSAYVTICFPDKIAGVWQGGSGLAKTGYAPVTPGYQGQCDSSSFETHQKSCCSNQFCSTCKYWPAWPRTCQHKVKHCIMAYTNDFACGTDWYMYEATTSEGNDARLLSFAGGSHKNPENAWSWIVGCLGVVESCSEACSLSFASCVQEQGGTSPTNFKTCEKKLQSGSMANCQTGCAPTLGMLSLSEMPVATLSHGMFGTQTGLARHSGSAPKPLCTTPFGKFSDAGVSTQCTPPAGWSASDPAVKQTCVTSPSAAAAPTAAAAAPSAAAAPTAAAAAPSAAAAPTAAAVKDTDGRCSGWVSYCNSNTYVSTNCKKTCSAASAAAAPTASSSSTAAAGVKDVDERCSGWNSFCQTNSYVATNCKKTCSSDLDERCSQWGSYCSSNDYVKASCFKTCAASAQVDKDNRCSQWQSYCTSNSYVINNCAKTCASSGGNDTDDRCSGWKSYCATNAYVQTNCKATCQN